MGDETSALKIIEECINASKIVFSLLFLQNLTFFLKLFIVIILLKVNKLIIGGVVALVIGSFFTASSFARRNRGRYFRLAHVATASPTSSPFASVTPSPSPTVKPTVKPTPRPTRTPTKTPNPKPTSISVGSSGGRTVYVTYYGWNDNDPPGTAIAYPKEDDYNTVHNGAGGTGTFSDPVTFAANPKVFSPGLLIYVPYIKKYALMEDSCASCVGNWIDIWTGGNGQNESQLIDCEESLTRDAESITINPSQGLEVNTAPLFDTVNIKCQF